MPEIAVIVEVGTPVARRPPHRSRRAVFPHRALQINSLSHAPAGLPPVAGSPAAVDRSLVPADKAFAEEDLAAKQLPAETLDQYQADSENLAGRLAVMTSNIAAATREIGQLNDQLESGVCKSCGQVIGHAEEHREELRLKIQQLERERAAQQARQAELKAEQAELKQRGDKLKAQIDAHNAAVQLVERHSATFTIHSHA